MPEFTFTATLHVEGDTPEEALEDYIASNDISGLFVLTEEHCEGCDHCRFPGVRWPSSPDGDTTHSYAERCDYCERFETDYDAAAHVAEALNVGIGLAYRCVWDDADEDAEVGKSIMGPQPPSDETRQAWINSPAGTSLFIDRPERDG